MTELNVFSKLYNLVDKVVDLSPNANPVRGTGKEAIENAKAQKIAKRTAKKKQEAKAAAEKKQKDASLKKFEEYAKEINSNDQRIIAKEAKKYVKHYKGTHRGNYKAENCTNIETGRPAAAARSKLFSLLGMEGFSRLDSAKLSSLIPRVRLFNVTNSGQTEFKFEDYQDPDSMTSSRAMRGTGAGIKSVSIDMDGTSPATAERQFKVSIKMFFSSLEEVFKDRGGYTYSDLIRYPESRRDPTDNSFSAKDYSKRIKMEYGYADPRGESLGWTDAEKSMIRRAKRIITLGFIKHEIDYNENGSLNITMEYFGYIEKESTNIDVLRLSLTTTERQRLDAAERGIKAATPKKGSQAPQQPQPAQGDVSGLKKTATEIRTAGYQAFLKNITSNRKVYRVLVTKFPVGAASGQDVNKYGIFGTEGDLKPASDSFEFKELKSTEKVVSFFYLGDLLDEVAELVKDHHVMTKGNYKLAFGSFMFRYIDGTIEEIPISGTPVSVEQFGKWFKEHVIKKGERTSYDLFSFIHDVLNAFVVETFSPKMQNTSYGTTVKASPQIRSQTFNTTKKIGNYTTASAIVPFLGVGGLNKGAVNYIFYYGINHEAESDIFTGRPSSDAANGVYWLVAGSEKGITKRVKYSKVEQKYLKEARMTQQGVNDSQRLLHNFYKANVELVGNPIFKPGMIVYITSNSHSQSQAEALGLGGYFQIVRVGNSIEDGRFQSDVEAIWLRGSPGRGAAAAGGKKPSKAPASSQKPAEAAKEAKKPKPSSAPSGSKSKPKPKKKDLKTSSAVGQESDVQSGLARGQ